MKLRPRIQVEGQANGAGETIARKVCEIFHKRIVLDPSEDAGMGETLLRLGRRLDETNARRARDFSANFFGGR
jgi:hypothetical protein